MEERRPTKSACYIYRVYDRATDEILEEGTVRGGSKKECERAAQRESGFKTIGQADKYRLWLTPAPEELQPKERTIKMIMAQYGYNIKRLSVRFDIPYRTVQNWANGTRECPSYIVKMISEILEKEKK